MKKAKPSLSEAEWEIMNAVWDSRRRVCVREVIERRYPGGEKAYTTVQTIMNILVDKGFLRREKIGLVNFYSPIITREHAVKRATKDLVSRIFQGSFGALAAFLVNSDSLTEQEIQELRELIAQKEAELKKQEKDDG